MCPMLALNQVFAHLATVFVLCCHDCARANGDSVTVDPAMQSVAPQRPHGSVIAVDKLREAAERGDVTAQFEHAQHLEHGIGQRRDLAEAAKWYGKAAQNSHCPSALALARLCLASQPQRDFKQAVVWLRRAANQGDTMAQVLLAWCHQHGLVTDDGAIVSEKSTLGGLWLLQLMQERNRALWPILLTEWEMLPAAVNPLPKPAVSWYEKAAMKGDEYANFELGAHFEGTNPFTGTPYFNRVVLREDPLWLIQVAMLYRMVRPGDVNSVKEADAYVRRAREKMIPLTTTGDPDVLKFLAIAEPDTDKSEEWYRREFEARLQLAQKGDLANQYRVAYQLERGWHARKDLPEAVHWYRRAAASGHALAQYRLGQCYLRGSGTNRDELEAVRWLKKATEQGVSDGILRH